MSNIYGNLAENHRISCRQPGQHKGVLDTERHRRDRKGKQQVVFQYFYKFLQPSPDTYIFINFAQIKTGCMDQYHAYQNIRNIRFLVKHMKRSVPHKPRQYKADSHTYPVDQADKKLLNLIPSLVHHNSSDFAEFRLRKIPCQSFTAVCSVTGSTLRKNKRCPNSSIRYTCASITYFILNNNSSSLTFSTPFAILKSILSVG